MGLKSITKKDKAYFSTQSADYSSEKTLLDIYLGMVSRTTNPSNNFIRDCKSRIAKGIHYPSLVGKSANTVAYSNPSGDYKANSGFDKHPEDNKVTIFEITYRARQSYVKK